MSEIVRGLPQAPKTKFLSIIDVKFLEKIPGTRKRYYQYTAIDDCTRLRVLRIYQRLSQRTSIQFIDYVLSRLPFRAEVIQTDNGLSCPGSSH